jgi:hypothetical protein
MKRTTAAIVLGLIFFSQAVAQNSPAISVCPASIDLSTPRRQVFNINLTILGSGFQPDAVVQLYPATPAQVTIQPAAVSATALRAVVSTALLPSPPNAVGQVQSIPVRVLSGGIPSQTVNITNGLPAPRFCALDPDQTTAGVASFRTTIYGAGLASGGFTVNWTVGQLTRPVQNIVSDKSGTA